MGLVALVAATSAAFAASPPTGAYGCYDATMAFSPVSGSHLQITPTPVAMFGLIDATTYADWDGHKGHYVYDAASGVLTMTDGSRQGWRYHKSGEWAFRLIDNRTGKEIYTCPLKAGGDPSHGPW
jgi:hypothetical protein